MTHTSQTIHSRLLQSITVMPTQRCHPLQHQPAKFGGTLRSDSLWGGDETMSISSLLSNLSSLRCRCACCDAGSNLIMTTNMGTLTGDWVVPGGCSALGPVPSASPNILGLPVQCVPYDHAGAPISLTASASRCQLNLRPRL